MAIDRRPFLGIRNMQYLWSRFLSTDFTPEQPNRSEAKRKHPWFSPLINVDSSLGLQATSFDSAEKLLARRLFLQLWESLLSTLLLAPLLLVTPLVLLTTAKARVVLIPLVPPVIPQVMLRVM